MTRAVGTPSGRGAEVLGRLVHRLLRFGVVAVTAAAKGVAAIVVTFLAVVGAILGGGAVFACLILVGVGVAAIGFEREARDGAQRRAVGEAEAAVEQNPRLARPATPTTRAPRKTLSRSARRS